MEQQQTETYFQHIKETIAEKRASGVTIYPKDKDIFNAFHYTELTDVKVVILGQDPYHGKGQAHGLSFSVQPSIKVPPSLVNIYKELAQDIDGFEVPNHGYLTSWAEQGVLLLNTVLTVEQGNAHSHAKLGWERFTSGVIELINQQNSGVIFLLWGAHAQKKGAKIDRDKHHVLTSVHPSPLSAYRGFFGCQHFSKSNVLLKQQGKTEINWQVAPI
ncbi:uracil-DNA glycosylase [Vibrio sp. SS-MA-C1-2]|nr:uracil-DNA glycosylase [Vibrio sp. SS-MA-C1-2]